MKKIFLNSGPHNINDIVSILNVKKSDYHHLVRVLRIRKNDEFFLNDNDNNEFYGKIILINKNEINIRILKKNNSDNSPVPKIKLFFSLLKSEKNDLIIQKCTELGISSFVPVVTNNTIIKTDNEKKQKKIIRWKKIAKESSMQSCQKKIPEINNFILFSELNNYDIKGLKIFGLLAEDSKYLINILKTNKKHCEVNLFIGPEGDFTDNEYKELINNGWIKTKLSPYVLRSETSAITAAAITTSFYLTEEKNAEI